MMHILINKPLSETLRDNFDLNQNATNFIRINEFENVVCKLAVTTLCRPQWVNELNEYLNRCMVLEKIILVKLG